MALLGFLYLVDRWRKEGGLHTEGFNVPGLEVEQSTSAHVPQARTQTWPRLTAEESGE